MGWHCSQCRGSVLHLELILHISSYFAFRQCHQCPYRLVTVSRGLSGVPSSKSRLLMCLMGNTELLCTQCHGIWPHLASRGKSHGFSRVAAGTLVTFLSYGGDGHSKLVFVQRRQDFCLVTRDSSGISSRLGRAIWTLFEVRRDTEGPFLDATVILHSYQFSRRLRHHHLLKH